MNRCQTRVNSFAGKARYHPKARLPVYAHNLRGLRFVAD